MLDSCETQSPRCFGAGTSISFNFTTSFTCNALLVVFNTTNSAVLKNVQVNR